MSMEEARTILDSFRQLAEEIEAEEHEWDTLEFVSACISWHGTDVFQREFWTDAFFFHSFARSLFLLSLFLKLGADVNNRGNRNETTPLMHCAQAPHMTLEGFKYLVDNHADLRAVDVHGKSVWDHAAEREHLSLELMCYLVQQGAPFRDEFSRIPRPLGLLLRPHLALQTLCIPLNLPRCKKDVWIVSDLIRTLKTYLV